MDIGFFVQLTDGRGRHLAAPQSLGDVLHPAHGNARQVHFDERFLHTAADQFIELSLDNFFVQLYNFPDIVCCLLSECLCGNFILPEICKPCLLLFGFQFAQLIVPYRSNTWSSRPLRGGKTDLAYKNNILLGPEMILAYRG